MVNCARAAAFLCAAMLAAVPAAAFYCNFESGLGSNAQPIGTSIAPGLMFSTTTGGPMLFADINTGNYRVTSDNGKVYEDGEYFVSGDVAAFTANLGDVGKATFLMGPASYVTVGYSSQFAFTLEAYDSLGTFLTSQTGAANVKSQGGTGLQYLTVSSPGIAYVLLHDQGGHWLVDNISTDAYVPEPGSALVLLTAVLGLALRRSRAAS